MYTAYIKEIDSIKVILGVDTEKLDPVETQKAIKPFLSATTESKIVADKFSKIAKYTADNQTSVNQGKRLQERVSSVKFKATKDLLTSDFTSTELESLKAYNAKIDENNDLIKTIQSELPEAQKNLKLKEKELMRSKGVYFNISENETRISDEQAIDYKQKLKSIQGEKKFLTATGEIIEDYRNKTFYGKISDKWEELQVTKLNQDVDLTVYIPQEDLTEDQKSEMAIQFETDRIDNLTNEERENEIKMLKENAVQQSINMRSKLDIEGDEKALEKSRAYYQEQVNLINEKYGISEK